MDLLCGIESLGEQSETGLSPHASQRSSQSDGSFSKPGEGKSKPRGRKIQIQGRKIQTNEGAFLRQIACFQSLPPTPDHLTANRRETLSAQNNISYKCYGSPRPRPFVLMSGLPNQGAPFNSDYYENVGRLPISARPDHKICRALSSGSLSASASLGPRATEFTQVSRRDADVPASFVIDRLRGGVRSSSIRMSASASSICAINAVRQKMMLRGGDARGSVSAPAAYVGKQGEET